MEGPDSYLRIMQVRSAAISLRSEPVGFETTQTAIIALPTAQPPLQETECERGRKKELGYNTHWTVFLNTLHVGYPKRRHGNKYPGPWMYKARTLSIGSTHLEYKSHAPWK